MKPKLNFYVSNRNEPRQKNEPEIHYLARTGLILIPYHWEWSEKFKCMISTKTGNPVEGLI